MLGIEIGKAISEHGINIVTGIFLVLVCWLVRYLVKEQSKNRKRSLLLNRLIPRLLYINNQGYKLQMP
ncbi:hypothetical protein ES695_08550, partial [Candidatus Atribacteria bacterium 1244-E10-H5-B2]